MATFDHSTAREAYRSYYEVAGRKLTLAIAGSRGLLQVGAG